MAKGKIAQAVRGLAGVVFGIAAMALLMAWLAGAFRDRILPGPSATPIERLPEGAATHVVGAVRVPVHREAVGAIAAEHEVAVAALVLGRVREVAASAGQAVEKGHVLVRLEDAEHQARAGQARAALAQAKDTFQRTQGLHARGAASDEQLAQARLAVEGAEQRVAEAETYLGYTVVRAPSAGVVIDRFCEVGDTVQPGQVLARLFDRLQFIANVPESLSERLHKDQPVEVFIDALGAGCVGSVAAIVPRADAAARSFQVKVTGPCKGGVIPGMFGRLRIPLGEASEVRIPRAAVRQTGQVSAVFVVGEDGALARRFVRLGGVRGERGDEVIVVAGLAEGERIVRSAAAIGGR